MNDDEFVITVHRIERVLEVQYPKRPTLRSFERYESAVRQQIDLLAKEGEWNCLVDQTRLHALAPEFPPRVALLNAWAKARGMRRTARLIDRSAVGELQTARILREAGVSTTASVFHDRRAAWTFLTSPKDERHAAV